MEPALALAGAVNAAWRALELRHVPEVASVLPGDHRVVGLLERRNDFQFVGRGLELAEACSQRVGPGPEHRGGARSHEQPDAGRGVGRALQPLLKHLPHMAPFLRFCQGRGEGILLRRAGAQRQHQFHGFALDEHMPAERRVEEKLRLLLCLCLGRTEQQARRQRYQGRSESARSHFVPPFSPSRDTTLTGFQIPPW